MDTREISAVACPNSDVYHPFGSRVCDRWQPGFAVAALEPPRAINSSGAPNEVPFRSLVTRFLLVLSLAGLALFAMPRLRPVSDARSPGLDTMNLLGRMMGVALRICCGACRHAGDA